MLNLREAWRYAQACRGMFHDVLAAKRLPAQLIPKQWLDLLRVFHRNILLECLLQWAVHAGVTTGYLDVDWVGDECDTTAFPGRGNYRHLQQWSIEDDLTHTSTHSVCLREGDTEVCVRGHDRPTARFPLHSHAPLVGWPRRVLLPHERSNPSAPKKTITF